MARIDQLGVTAAFKGYHGYPAALCTSINEEVVHGIPNARACCGRGDVVSIDCGVILDGFYSDAAVTYAVGVVSERTQRAAADDGAIAGCGN